MPDAVVPVVLAEGEAQIVDDVDVDLEPPAIEVEKPQFKVIIERCEVLVGKVLIIGVVKVNVMFKTGKEVTVDDDTGVVVCGNVRHCTAFVPFTASIDLPGVAPGDECQIVCVGVEGAVVEGAEPVNGNSTKKAKISFAVVIEVRVTRDLLIDITGQIRTQLSPVFVFPRR